MLIAGNPFLTIGLIAAGYYKNAVNTTLIYLSTLKLRHNSEQRRTVSSGKA
jgi:hypothetical protein